MTSVTIAWVVIAVVALLIVAGYGWIAKGVETEKHEVETETDNSTTPPTVTHKVKSTAKTRSQFLEYYFMPFCMLAISGLLGAFIGAVMLPPDLQHSLHGILDPAVPTPVAGQDFEMTNDSEAGVTSISFNRAPADDLEWVIMHEGKEASMFEGAEYKVPEGVKEVYVWFYRKATRNPGEIATAKVE